MRVFVSSSFEDLREHRTAAIRVLRQLGHEVVAMEDFVAGRAVPLQQVLDKVERCEVYVGLFAWRYGFVPRPAPEGAAVPPTPPVPGADFGATSITHYEYLHARAKGLEILAFLLDESCPWPPYLIDGFATNDPQAPRDASSIRALRSHLQLNHVVSYFASPADLEARVSAAVTVAGMTRQVRLNLLKLASAPFSTVPDSDMFSGIRQTILAAGQQRILKVDLDTTWWSTRLYLTAALAERVTSVRRIVVARGPTFVGLLSTSTILAALPARHPVLAGFQARLQKRKEVLPDVQAEMGEVLALWKATFGGDEAKARETELAAKVVCDEPLLQRWFGDAMLRQPVRLGDLARASVIDLLRILDYPADFVPVVSRHREAAPVSPGPVPAASSSQVAATPPLEAINVVDKSALNSQLAQSYVTELMDRARLG